MDTLEDWISKLDNRLTENTQWSTQREKIQRRKMTRNVRIMWDMLKNSNICIIGFKKGKKDIDWDRSNFWRDNGREFFITDGRPQATESRTPSSKNLKKILLGTS